MKNDLRNQVQINVPFSMLSESYLDYFIRNYLNPEIGFDAQTLDRCPVTLMEAVAGRLQEAGLTITFHAPFMDLSPGSPDSMIRDLTRRRLEQVVPLISLFKPLTVVCHTGYDRTRYWHIRELWLKNSLDIWSGIAGEIQSRGARMMLENVYEASPDDMAELLENLKGLGVGFCLDCGHQAVFGKAPIEDWIDRLGPYLGQLHLHDNCGVQDEHLALGRGCIDFARLFHLIAAGVPGRPVVTLEPHREEDLWPGLEYLERIWPW